MEGLDVFCLNGLPSVCLGAFNRFIQKCLNFLAQGVIQVGCGVALLALDVFLDLALDYQDLVGTALFGHYLFLH